LLLWWWPDLINKLTNPAMSSPAQQAANELRWWLKLPPVNLIARQDHIRFRHAMYLVIHQVASVLYTVNNLPDTMYFPSRLSGARPAFDGMLNAPVQAGNCLTDLACTRDATLTWQRASKLITETLAFVETASDAPIEKVQEVVAPCSPGQMQNRADAIAVRLHLVEEVEAVMLGGSLARGTADEQSDIDIHVFCRVLPSADIRRNLIAAWPDVQQPPLIEPACDTVWLGGVLVHLRYWQSGEVDQWLRFLSSPYQTMLLAEELQIGQALFDPGKRISSWQQIVALPPRALVEMVIGQARQRLAAFRVLWHEACALQDPIHQYCLMNQAVHDWLVACYIRNNRFLSTPRWTHRDMMNLPYIPDNLDRRLIGLVDAIENVAEANRRFSDLEILWTELPGF
jgi:hypothetical protein